MMKTTAAVLSFFLCAACLAGCAGEEPAASGSSSSASVSGSELVREAEGAREAIEDELNEKAISSEDLADTQAAEAVEAAEAMKDEFLADFTGAMDIAGSWEDEVSQRAGMDAVRNDDGSYDIKVHWGSSAFETAIWEIHGTYDEVSGMLSYEDGRFYMWSVDEDGSETISDEQTTSGSFMKEGEKLRWEDSRNSDSGLFVKVSD